MIPDITFIAEWWQDAKTQLELLTGLDRDSMHIYAALLVQLAAALVTRRSVGQWVPWFVVLFATGMNELVDIAQFSDRDHVPGNYWPNTIRDIWNTMLLPTVLLLVVRYGPKRMFRRGR